MLIALSLTLAISMIACSDSSTDVEGEGTYTPGTYQATAQGHNEEQPVVVEVTFDADKITDVKVVEHGETDGIGSNAVDQLPGAIVEGQTLKLDAVTGATATSNAIIEAVSDAVTQAGGDPSSLK